MVLLCLVPWIQLCFHSCRLGRLGSRTEVRLPSPQSTEHRASFRFDSYVEFCLRMKRLVKVARVCHRFSRLCVPSMHTNHVIISECRTFQTVNMMHTQQYGLFSMIMPHISPWGCPVYIWCINTCKDLSIYVYGASMHTTAFQSVNMTCASFMCINRTRART